MLLLDNPICMMFMSFFCGVYADAFLKRRTNYEWLSGWYLFRNPRTYAWLGIRWFKMLMLKTPLGSFNKHILVTKGRDLESLRVVRSHMVSSEIGHWVGFVAMLAMTLCVWWLGRSTLVLTGYVVFNVLGNVYPALLQQYNKRRLERLIAIIARREQLTSPLRQPTEFPDDPLQRQ